MIFSVLQWLFLAGGYPNCPCVYVVQIFDNTPASREGTLESGDEITAVNNKSVKGKTKNEVVKAIQTSSVRILGDKIACCFYCRISICSVIFQSIDWLIDFGHRSIGLCLSYLVLRSALHCIVSSRREKWASPTTNSMPNRSKATLSTSVSHPIFAVHLQRFWKPLCALCIDCYFNFAIEIFWFTFSSEESKAPNSRAYEQLHGGLVGIKSGDSMQW